MFSRIRPSATRRFTLRIGLAFAVGASLTGCAVGPKYQRPTVKLQPFHNAPSIEARTASLPAPPLDQWWTGFHDPELTRIVKRALDENLDLAAAMTRVQQARAAAQGAGAQRIPSGNLNASTTTLYQSTESMTGRLAVAPPGYSRISELLRSRIHCELGNGSVRRFEKRGSGCYCRGSGGRSSPNGNSHHGCRGSRRCLHADTGRAGSLNLRQRPDRH